METTRCKVCMRKGMQPFLEFPRYPGSISQLYEDADNARKDVKVVSFIQCTFCNHVQLSNDTPQSFYEEYIMTVSHSPKMVEFQKAQCKQFVTDFSLKGKKVLEVGCGDGHFLSLLVAAGVEAYGNEPSNPFRELALKKNLNVSSGFVDENFIHPQGPFDAVITREVMEHVPQPVEFLKNIRNQLKPGGVLLVEIPNFEKALQEARFYDMFPDHISYFTKSTLTATVLNAGYHQPLIHYGMDDEFIFATAIALPFQSDHLKGAVPAIHNDLKTLGENYKSIVVWGAGGKGIAALASAPTLHGIKYVVDSDPFKQGKFLPGSGLLVNSPDVLFKDQTVDLLLITNLAYTDEILAILKEKGFSKKAMVLSKNGIQEIHANK